MKKKKIKKKKKKKKGNKNKKPVTFLVYFNFVRTNYILHYII